MSFDENKRNEIKLYLLRKIQEDDEFVVSKVADAFGVSMTSVKRYIDSEISDNHICLDSDRKCKYNFVFERYDFVYDLKQLSENDDEIIYEDVLPLIKTNKNALNIWSYTLSEIFNNSIEHSFGKKVTVNITMCCLFTKITIVDDGIGVFKSILDYKYKNAKKENDLREAVLELYKGKFTSCPKNHSGEGIFFTSKMLDKFALVSDGAIFKTGYEGDFELINSHLLSYAMKFTKKGTVVVMELENETTRKAIEVFDEFSNIDEGLIKTRIPVFEACRERNPIARSQARRIAERLDKFKEVELDFSNTEIMAQGFADELFRVFQNENPEVKLIPTNMNKDIEWMYLHAIHYKP
ncbi:protein of unknown function [Lachnospiraceae bacterium G41]|nr:protein of unknown function [Lachnospiraceae bacterium G41]